VLSGEKVLDISFTYSSAVQLQDLFHLDVHATSTINTHKPKALYRY